MKWYTAIGVKCSGADGRFYVKTGQEEKILSGMEIQIWTSLLWAICEESEIYERVQGLMKLAFGVEERREADREEFRYCFRRLENRGLICPCEGKTAEEAALSLMRRVTMVRVRITTAERFKLFCNSLGMGRGLRFSMRAFRREEFTEKEKRLVEILEENGGLAYHLRKLEDKAEKVSSLVGEPDVSFCASVQKEFLAEVIRLYGKKQLFIESIQGEAMREKDEMEQYAAAAGMDL